MRWDMFLLRDEWGTPLIIFFTQKHVGYMVAQATMVLRLVLLRSIFSARWKYFVRQPVGRLANAMMSHAALFITPCVKKVGHTRKNAHSMSVASSG